MKGADIFRELSYLDPELIISAQPECETDAFGTDFVTERKSGVFSRLLRPLAAVACICVVATVIFMFKSGLMFGYNDAGDQMEGDNGASHGPDVSYGAYFDGWYYSPFANFSDDAKAWLTEKYPKLGTWKDGATSAELPRGVIGEYIGIFPQIEEIGLEAGRAYRHAAYPDCEMLIIVERGREYFLYISDGNELPVEFLENSSSALEKLGMPNSLLAFELNEKICECDRDTAFRICELISGKSRISASSVSDEIFSDWCAENGDAAIEPGSEEQKRYAEFFARSLYSVILFVDNGAEPILRFDTEYGYIQLCGAYYRADAAALRELAGIFGTETCEN